MKRRTSYRVAIVGCGRMAGSIDDERPRNWAFKPSTHAGAYRAVKSTTIVAAANRERNTLDAFCSRWEVPAAYQDYRDMIEKEKPDIISICTPQESHSEITIFAAKHGVRGILCEKPMAASVDEADRMVEAVQLNGVSFNLGVNRRFRMDCGIARRLIDDGELGEIRSFHLAARGTLKNSHSHYIDLMCYLLQDPSPLWLIGKLHQTIDATARSFDEDSCRWIEDPGLHWLVVQFAEGKTGYLHDPQGVVPREWRVIGTKGFLVFTEDGRPPRWGTPEGDKRFPEYPAKHSPTVRMVEDLLDSVETGRPCLANENISARIVELSSAAAESHLKGSVRVELPLVGRDMFIPAHGHSGLVPNSSAGRSPRMQ